ncbi:hypothetical protein AB0N14_33000 [Streptomyces sp. NPDC051104]
MKTVDDDRASGSCETGEALRSMGQVPTSTGATPAGSAAATRHPADE